ncbi:Lin1244/Lin1753 domain-containing protein [Salipaludibacillus sp. CF4.18]|uniref:Lin1244/Lin1753 domain-containing protein n=1 Tax=Salipaludibacillus sp. CF4.18 TaxID=3373081 RepID=UPI003EE7D0D3
MARPIKQGLEFFSLDVKMDDETELIEAEHGHKGFVILIKMFQKIYSNGYFLNWNEKQQILFSKKVSVDTNEVTDIINDCVKWDIFNSDLYERFGILTSRRIQEHYVRSTYKRSKVEMIEEYLLIDVSDAKNVTTSRVSDVRNSDTTIVTDDESTHSTVQDSTVQNSKEDKENSSSSEFENPFEFFQQNIGVLKPIVSQSIAEWCEDLSDEMVTAAMMIAVKNGVYKFSYAETILKEWNNNNLKTIDDVRAYEEEKKANKDQKTRINGARWNQPQEVPVPKALTESQEINSTPEEMSKAKAEADKYKRILAEKKKQRIG